MWFFIFDPKYKIFKKLRNGTPWKFNTKLGRKMQFLDAIWWRHNKSKMADGRHIENRFLAISRRHIGRLIRNLELRWRITCRYWSHDENGNFRKFKMADGRHFENSFISILSRELSDFYQIWFTDANFHSFKIKMADGPHIENRFWLYLDALLAN